MSQSATISILNKTFCQATDIRQFAFQSGPGKNRRRIGLTYYILYADPEALPPHEGGGHTAGAAGGLSSLEGGGRRPEGDLMPAGILIQQTIDSTLTKSWLQDAISRGLIYLEKIDYDITLSALASLRETKTEATP